ncbi:HD-GYP domain-containing protein [Paenibacillus sp. 481]|nr:HD-GYP domain-containing protein [Paenibacillus sp. 481]
MRVQVTELVEGDVVKRSVFNEHGLHVLSAGTVLDEREIHTLLRHHIDYIDIENRQLHTQSGSDNIVQMQVHYEEALSGVRQLLIDAARVNKIDDNVVQEALNPLMDQLTVERDVVSLMMQLNNQDDYTCQHSVHVGMLSYFLATWLGYELDDSLRIGKAGYLHDIGKCKIDPQILNKPGKLTADEFEVIKQHTVAGHDIIMNSYDDEWLAVAALYHHERLDGRGYVHGLKGDEIPDVAKIVAIADIYSAMTSTRVYQAKQDHYKVLQELHQMSYTGLDAKMTQTFIRHMLPNFINKQVILNDGRAGVIVMTNNTEYFRPLVRVDEGFVDLADQRHMTIEQIL